MSKRHVRLARWVNKIELTLPLPQAALTVPLIIVSSTFSLLHDTALKRGL